ncbi:MAG: aldo/keto reductase [Candidatus Eremiobacteraeota bacterium]|nr:aldo/keto reductase [Candidatus Eremiobacteraeota bacterium]
MSVSSSVIRAGGEIPKRRLGRTQEHVSLIGMGGFHLGAPHRADTDMIDLMHAGIDRGITFLDNSWDYNSGMSELRMGRALCARGYRDKVFLMTKVDGRTSAAFTQQLEESLARLLTDRLDLVQFHENIRPDDADRIFADGGAFEAALEAKRAGKVRFIGFTGHKSPDYHLHMIELATERGFTFDTVQMPLNIFDAHFESFEKKVVPVAQRLDMGILAMKTFGDKSLLDTGVADPIEMLHYGMNLPTSVVITGIDTPEILDQAVRAATTFAPLGAERVAALLARSAALAQDGAQELYKTTRFFDSTFQNPSWLG